MSERRMAYVVAVAERSTSPGSARVNTVVVEAYTEGAARNAAMSTCAASVAVHLGLPSTTTQDQLRERGLTYCSASCRLDSILGGVPLPKNRKPRADSAQAEQFVVAVHVCNELDCHHDLRLEVVFAPSSDDAERAGAERFMRHLSCLGEITDAMGEELEAEGYHLRGRYSVSAHAVPLAMLLSKERLVQE